MNIFSHLDGSIYEIGRWMLPSPPPLLWDQQMQLPQMR